MQFLIRITGIVGLVLCVIPFQFKKHKHIVLCKMSSEIVFALQYLIMGLTGISGAYTAAMIDLISGSRNLFYHKFVSGGKSTTPLIIGFSILVIIIGMFSWGGAVSLLPITAKLITTVSYGMKKEKLLRFITLPSCILWIIYNLIVGSWEGAVADSLAFASILVAIYKFDLKGTKENA